MASFEGKLFVAWEEVNENKRSPRRQIRVKAYNGTNFSFVESGAAAGLNQNSLNDAYTAFLAVHNAKLFITFHERGKVRVKVYAGGTTWNFTDGGGTTGINSDLGSYADLSSLISFNGKLYAGIRQDLKMRMLSYDGVSWQYADGSSASQGLNYDPAQRAGRPVLQVHNGMLYLAWMEQNSSTKYTVRMRALNPNAIVPSFDFIDGGAQYGISFDLSQNAYFPSLSSANSKLYLGLVGADAQSSVRGLDQAMAAVMNNE